MISAGAPPQTPLGELTALSDPLAVFKGPTSKGKEGRGRGRDGRGVRPYTPPVANSWLRHWSFAVNKDFQK